MKKGRIPCYLIIMPEPQSPPPKYEPQFTVPGWKNPYVIYIALTLLLFLFLVLLGYVAWTQGWIPSRGAVS